MSGGGARGEGDRGGRSEMIAEWAVAGGGDGEQRGEGSETALKQKVEQLTETLRKYKEQGQLAVKRIKVLSAEKQEMEKEMAALQLELEVGDVGMWVACMCDDSWWWCVVWREGVTEMVVAGCG